MTNQSMEKTEPSPNKEVQPKQKRNNLLRYGGIVIAVAVTAIIFIFRDQLKEVEKYGYVGIFLLNVIGNATIVLPAPTILTAFAGGGVFNPIAVGIIAAAGATIGELTGYLAGLSGQAIVENREAYERFQVFIQKYGLRALFLLAAIPNPLFDLAGIIAGISKIPIPTFLLVTWAGKIVKFLLIAYLGSFFSSLWGKS